MGVLKDKRMQAIRDIIATLKEIDDRNLVNPEEYRMVDKDKFVSEIMGRFQVSKVTAEDYFKSAKAIYQWEHEEKERILLKRECA